MSKLIINSGGGRNFKLRILKFISFILIYCLMITGSTYAYLTLENTNDEEMIGNGECNTIQYSAQEINANELYATNNYLEGATTTVTLSYNRGCDVYTYANIYLHTNDTTTSPIVEVPSMRYRVYDGNTLLTQGIISEMGDVILATVPLTVEPVTYTIYLWIDPILSKGTYENTAYSGYIYASSAQTSTLNGFLVRDLSYNTNNGIAYGATWNKDEGTVTTDGVDDYIDCGLEGYDFGDDLSMVVRVKMHTSETQQALFGNWEAAGGGLTVYNDNTFYAMFALGSYNNYNQAKSIQTISKNVWYTLVTVYDGSNLILYKDGEVMKMVPATGNISISELPLAISANPNPNSITEFANATYSDVLLFDDALTESEITSYYSGEINSNNVDKTDLLLYYNFENDNRNNTIYDLSDNHNAAFLSGAAWDKNNGLVTTDGVDDYIDCGLENYDFKNKVTIVTRIKFLSIDSSEAEIDLISNYQLSGLGLWLQYGKLSFDIYVEEEAAYVGLDLNFQPELNVWYTIVGVYDGANMSLYINGQKMGSIETTGNIKTTSFPVIIGANPENYGYDCFLNATYDDVLLFDRALTENEITNYYSGEIIEENVSKDNLLFYYNFS